MNKTNEPTPLLAVRSNAGLGIADVKTWLILGGIGHILMGTNSGWHMTACHMMTPNGREQTARAVRKCKKCLTELPSLRTATPNKI